MDVDAEYKKSVELYIKSQELNIEQIKKNADYLKFEIELKQKMYNILLETIEHEVNFLENYKKDNYGN